MEVILVNTPPEYGNKLYISNITYMLEKVNSKFEKIHVIDDVVYGGVYDKLRIFDKFRDGQYLYLDLDVVIKSNIDHLCRESFTLLDAWWRPMFHTPLNSSIMSWKGNYSHIHDKFAKDPDYYMIKYNKGIDEFIYKEIEYKTYGMVCNSFNWNNSDDYPVTLYNQAKDKMWDNKFTLSV